MGSDADEDAEPEQGLGGKLIYVGELDRDGRALLIAASIAGAASLAASADPDRRLQAYRDGAADFLVTSLDEALRILKNQIRKREAVAVCVAAGSEDVQQEMEERGVLADLLPPIPAAPDPNSVLLAWRIDTAPALWLPRLDALMCDLLDPEDGTARRWLRLAPRYLGRLAQGERLLCCPEATAVRLIDTVRDRVESAQIGVPVEMRLIRHAEATLHSFAPQPY